MKRWILFLIALWAPAEVVAQLEFGQVKVERVTQERRWVDVLVTYKNTTKKTFSSVEIQCIARSASGQLLGEETWFHGEPDSRPRFRPGSESVVTVQIDIRNETPRVARTTCSVVRGREARVPGNALFLSTT